MTPACPTRRSSDLTIKLDVRVVSATNAELPVEVAAGRFRKDLLYRLNTVEIRLPPLRERREAITAMANDLLQRFGQRYQRDGLRLSPSALHALQAWNWPGNVRELSPVVERAVLKIGRASRRERGGQYGYISVVAVILKNNTNEINYLNIVNYR